MDRTQAIVLGLIALLAVAWLVPARKSEGSLRVSEKDRLLYLCLGDKRQMRRLVALEKRKAPGISTREATSRALAFALRDNNIPVGRSE
jgi:hypothetical protein